MLSEFWSGIKAPPIPARNLADFWMASWVIAAWTTLAKPAMITVSNTTVDSTRSSPRSVTDVATFYSRVANDYAELGPPYFARPGAWWSSPTCGMAASWWTSVRSAVPCRAVARRRVVSARVDMPSNVVHPSTSCRPPSVTTTGRYLHARPTGNSARYASG